MKLKKIFRYNTTGSSTYVETSETENPLFVDRVFNNPVSLTYTI